MIENELNKKAGEEVAKFLPEVYKDLGKPAIQEIGNVSGRTVKALLSPLRAMLWGWERIEGLIEEGVNSRLEKIPEERRKSPEPEIAVPLMQALNYTAHNEVLREMYLNLLANSMDVAKENYVHPSFVEMIKQMNSLDAKVFDKICQENGYQKILNPTLSPKGSGSYYTQATPAWFMGWTIDGYNIFDVSASFVRLSKFGLIDLMHNRTAGKGSYDLLMNHDAILEILEKYKLNFPNVDIVIEGTKSLLHLNEYGSQFKIACR